MTSLHSKCAAAAMVALVIAPTQGIATLASPSTHEGILLAPLPKKPEIKVAPGNCGAQCAIDFGWWARQPERYPV